MHRGPTNTSSYDDQSVALLRGLVAIPSLSYHESDAASWLVAQMADLGFERTYVDSAGNAVGEIGDESSENVLVLLGHIDTVPGNIPVRIENEEGDDVLYGRGSVDAKGPLATFVMAISRLGAQWAHDNQVRILVIGAVEEEAATSKGARFIRDRFNGQHEPRPGACIIGEPSSWNRVTLGYKGRLLINVEASQPMAHSAGPDAGIAVHIVELWNWLAAQAEQHNDQYDRLFEQVQPSIRHIHTSSDAHMNDVVISRFGIRLPLDFAATQFANGLLEWCRDRIGATAVGDVELIPGEDRYVDLEGSNISMHVAFQGYEPAWRSARNSALVRAFLGSIREQGEKPGFVVKTGTSDMNVVAPEWQCPILAYGPGDSSLDHTPNEHLSVNEYVRAIDILAGAVKNLVQYK